MSNVEKFRNHLNSVNLYMEELNDEYGTFFRVPQAFKEGGEAILVASFNKEEDLVDLNIYNIAQITNPLKKEQLHGLINELNFEFRFTKFMEKEGRVTAQYSMDLRDQMNAQEVLGKLVMLFQCAEQNYSKFMKLQWA